jgi:2-oxoglutarate ferredoxin oxidoreductase subunit gamma
VSLTEVRIGGFGGQGVILSGYILGKAASIYDGKHATMTQSFGPEARGSACSSQVVISDETILYPYVTKPDLLVTMSQEAYSKFKGNLKPGGKLLIEEELVKTQDGPDEPVTYGIPATRMAEELGRKIVLNIVMVGFFAGVTDVIAHDAVRKAVESSVPRGTEELNLKAFDSGYEYGAALVKGKK